METAFPFGDRIAPPALATTRGPVRSLVIIWRSGTEALDWQLGSWAGALRAGMDVVVVHACSSAERVRLERDHAGVRVLVAPADREVRVLRELGVRAARGDIVEVRDDTQCDEIGWLLRRAAADPADDRSSGAGGSYRARDPRVQSASSS
ncbi:MAG TPA: hypothetical protein VHM30_18180 [Gemmatimonadaceae bacterium]|nr:hypothetical protein [Gemmatimonadaceae bacterium]